MTLHGIRLTPCLREKIEASPEFKALPKPLIIQHLSGHADGKPAPARTPQGDVVKQAPPSWKSVAKKNEVVMDSHIPDGDDMEPLPF